MAKRKRPSSEAKRKAKKRAEAKKRKRKKNKEKEAKKEEEEEYKKEEREVREEGGGHVPPAEAPTVRLPPPPATTRTRTPSYPSDGRYRNKQRCLVLCTRGVTARYRHLLEDLRTLIPHHKRESKLDADEKDVGTGGIRGMGGAVNDIADVRGCNTALVLECRKRTDAYLWIGRTPGGGSGGGSAAGGTGTGGPSVKFHVSNVHTMDELRLTGNCMNGSRPVLSFDRAFETHDHLRLMKALFVDVFGTPRGHPKSKPFVDRVMGFYWADGKIWVRNYQILHSLPPDARSSHVARRTHGGDPDGRETSLVEIGPRFVLDPMRVFRGPFGGQTLYRNVDFVSPNEVRAREMAEVGNKFEDRSEAKRRRVGRREEIREGLPIDPLGDVFD